MTDEKILHLTIKKKWFDLIKSGAKKFEFREFKPHWISRLMTTNGCPIDYDYIIFRNGYQKDSPKLKVEYKGFIVTRDEDLDVIPEEFIGKQCFAIELGKVTPLK